MGPTLPGHGVQRSERRKNVADATEMKGRAGIGDSANFVVVGDVQIISVDVKSYLIDSVGTFFRYKCHQGLDIGHDNASRTAARFQARRCL